MEKLLSLPFSGSNIARKVEVFFKFLNIFVVYKNCADMSPVKMTHHRSFSHKTIVTEYCTIKLRWVWYQMWVKHIQNSVIIFSKYFTIEFILHGLLMWFIILFFVLGKITSSLLLPLGTTSACDLLHWAGQKCHIALGSRVSASKSDFVCVTKTFMLFSWFIDNEVLHSVWKCCM